MRIKKLDLILFAIPLLITIISFAFIFNQSGKASAEILVNGKCVRTIDLTSEHDSTIDLKLEYHNIIEIKDHKIRVVSAECGDHTCINTGFISKPGEVIACVPSKLVIRISGKKQEYDVIAGMRK